MSVISRVRWSVVAFLAILFVITTGATPIVAGSLREGSTLSNGVSAGGPGEALWTYYDLTGAAGGAGDNILTLINPNGSANPTLIGRASDACAMIYVFDDDQEMGECCGCPISPAGIETFSVEHDLTSDWGITGAGGRDNASGVISVIATSVRAPRPAPALLDATPLLSPAIASQRRSTCWAASFTTNRSPLELIPFWR
jgi:hypothetical protein